MNSKIDLSICIVNWNTHEFLDHALQSIQKTVTDLSCEILVVDNASEDGSQKMVAQKYPDVTLIANTENRGFAAANNQALEKASGEWVFFLNPDTELLPHCVTRLLHYLKTHPDVGMVAPKLLNTDGTVQRSVRRFPNFKTALYRYTFLKKIGLFALDEAQNKMDDFDFNTQRSVEQPAGAALLISKKLLDQVGWMDPSFFLFYEEVDLCYRVKKRGYDIVYLPYAELIHHSGKARQKNRKNIFLPTLRSLFYYFSKHHGAKKTHAFKWLFKPLFILSTVWDVIEESISCFVYQIKKDSYRADRKRQLYSLKLEFLKQDLSEFIFRV